MTHGEIVTALDLLAANVQRKLLLNRAEADELAAMQEEIERLRIANGTHRLDKESVPTLYALDSERAGAIRRAKRSRFIDTHGLLSVIASNGARRDGNGRQ